MSQVPLSSIKVVQEEKTTGKWIGLATDPQENDLYAFSDSSIFKILIDNEERDVWRLFLEKALDKRTSKEEYFDVAHSICSGDSKKRDYVL